MTDDQACRIEIDGETYQRLPDECVRIVEAIAAEHGLPVHDVMNLLWKQFNTPRYPGETDDEWANRIEACKDEMPCFYSRGDDTLH